MSNKTLYIMAYLENIALIILAGFLCWMFHSGWGVLVLLFSNSVKRTLKGDRGKFKPESREQNYM